MKYNNRYIDRGFTLIELMIATSLFTIIMLMGIGSLVASSNSAKAAQKLRIAVDNVNFAMESMTRELRTGTHYYCGASMNEEENDCLPISGDNKITFTPQPVLSNPIKRVGYYLEARQDGSGTNTLKRCEDYGDNCSDIVSSNVDVRELRFYVKGSYLPPSTPSVPPEDNIQPSVQILMSGYVKTKTGFTPFTLQSMASQRSSE